METFSRSIQGKVMSKRCVMQSLEKNSKFKQNLAKHIQKIPVTAEWLFLLQTRNILMLMWKPSLLEEAIPFKESPFFS